MPNLQRHPESIQEIGEVAVKAGIRNCQIILRQGDRPDCKVLGQLAETWRVAAGEIAYSSDYNDDDEDNGPWTLSVGKTFLLNDPDGRGNFHIETRGDGSAIIEAVLEPRPNVSSVAAAADSYRAPLAFTLSRLRELEESARIAALEVERHKIGGNFPPEDIDEIAAIAVEGYQLLVQLPTTSKKEDVKSLREKLVRYTNIFSEGFVQEAGKEAGKHVGKNLGRAIGWSLLATMVVAMHAALNALGMLEAFL